MSLSQQRRENMYHLFNDKPTEEKDCICIKLFDHICGWMWVTISFVLFI
jgi:hypothetical protein